jgi:hypothetical protein
MWLSCAQGLIGHFVDGNAQKCTIDWLSRTLCESSFRIESNSDVEGETYFILYVVERGDDLAADFCYRDSGRLLRQ